MLQQLSVDNYILIPHLELNFTGGFTCITGETGAGKSILVGALSLLMGQRADTTVLREPLKKCIIEANFNIANYQLEHLFEKYELDFEKSTVFRREINQQGKSRAFINDTPVTLAIMKEIGARLLDIHSQHQTLELQNSAFQLGIVDAYAQNIELLQEYNLIYKKVNLLRQELALKNDLDKQSSAEREYLQFQFEELENAKLSENEQDEAELELDTLTHAEDIKGKTYAAVQMLVEDETNIISLFNDAQQLIEHASKHSSALGELKIRMQQVSIEMKDLTSELRIQNERIIYDKNKIDILTQRLDSIYKLEQKHRVSTIVELLTFMNQLSEKLNKIDSLEDEINKLKNEIQILETELLRISRVLSDKRFGVIQNIELQMEKLLVSLGMPSARFQIKIEKLDHFTSSGCDKINFLFSANKGTDPKNIELIASGGELSRLMLSIKSLILNQSMLPTILFDEIDTGVSGEIAGKVGSILRMISERMQVIAITHLPQIAGKADSHYLAYKTDDQTATVSNLRLLNEEERIMEIARMLSDEKVTESAKNTAKELLNFKN